MNDHNQIAYEEAAIYALLHLPDSNIASRLTAAHFTDRVLQKVFTAAAGIVIEGRAPDLFAVADGAAAAAPNGASPNDYLARITDITRNVFLGQADPAVYCDKLDQRLQSRQVEALGRSISTLAADAGMEPHERLGLVRKMVEGAAINATQAGKPKLSPLQKLRTMKLTQQQIDELEESVEIIPDLLIHGHILVVPAEANGGKTTLFLHLAGEMAAKGYQPIYINCDTSGGDAKPMFEQAERHGFELITPDLSGTPVTELYKTLEEMAAGDDDLSRVVLIFDTMKKFVEVINKGGLKSFFALCRRLTGKGATIVHLAHTNKYLDANGNPVFEGCGDVRNDTDDLIYLIPMRNDDRTMTISTKVDKVRGTLGNVTFSVDADRNVTRAKQFTDVAKLRLKQQAEDEQADVIEAIVCAIAKGRIKQHEIIADCAEDAISKGRVLKALKEFSRPPVQRFYMRRGMQKNVLMYSLEPWNSPPPENRKLN